MVKRKETHQLMEVLKASVQEWPPHQQHHMISPQCHHIWQALLQRTDHWSSLGLFQGSLATLGLSQNEPIFSKSKKDKKLRNSSITLSSTIWFTSNMKQARPKFFKKRNLQINLTFSHNLRGKTELWYTYDPFYNL